MIITPYNQTLVSIFSWQNNAPRAKKEKAELCIRIPAFYHEL
jgi:hypothetical protein